MLDPPAPTHESPTADITHCWREGCGRSSDSQAEVIDCTTTRSSGGRFPGISPSAMATVVPEYRCGAVPALGSRSRHAPAPDSLLSPLVEGRTPLAGRNVSGRAKRCQCAPCAL